MQHKPIWSLKKILLIRFSSIGDIVLTTPVVRCLKQQLGAELHYLTKRSFRVIVDPNPYIDKVYAIEKGVGEVLSELRREGYDAIVDLHRNLRSFQVKLGLLGVRSYVFDKLNLEKWLMVNFGIDRLPDRHIVDRYLEAAAPLGIRNDNAGLDYFIPEAEEIHPENLASLLRKEGWGKAGEEGRLANGGYIAFAIGAAHATKRLPEDEIIRLCRRLSRPVLLLGGPGDAATGERVARAAGGWVLSTCGKLSLHQSASLVRQARLLITHDTGLMHIAAAFRKPILSLWGNTIPEFGMYPYLPEGAPRGRIFEVRGLSCRPCSKIGHASCPKGHFRCMRDLSLESILEEAERHF